MKICFWFHEEEKTFLTNLARSKTEEINNEIYVPCNYIVQRCKEYQQGRKHITIFEIQLVWIKKYIYLYLHATDNITLLWSISTVASESGSRDPSALILPLLLKEQESIRV